MSTYEQFFSDITTFAPFPYQARLGTEAWPSLLDVPTGLGKTAAVVIAWLHKRLTDDGDTGRRLVYCLPTRVLVDQTRLAAEAWVKAAAPRFRDAGRAAPSVHVLRGGELDERWQGEPESEAILIGTQDMLLSRALNRGFAMSPSRWPMHFAWLNNDAFWVFDEIQLMGVGVETSAQLQAFRDGWGVEGPSRSLWMSATVGAGQLATVDHPAPSGGFPRHTLLAEDRALDRVLERTQAKKRVILSELALGSSKKADEAAHLEALANEVATAHEERGGLTLVILNSVKRARGLRALLSKKVVELGLIHSRFRAPDRRVQEAMLAGEADRVVVATQAIEAGVDVSARTLFTELAPWPSMIQRIGRCNRYGKEAQAEVRVVDLRVEDDDALALPYDPAAMLQARGLLHDLGDDASPARLSAISFSPPVVVRPVVRRRDLLQLFDTTPDLFGNDVDVSRFIRDDQDTDVQVFWRSFEGTPAAELPGPGHGELCAVSIGAARDLVEKKLKSKRAKAKGEATKRLWAYAWDRTRGEWARVERPHPGQVLLLHVSAGGYDPELGFTGELRGDVPAVQPAEPSPRSDADQLAGDARSQGERWVELSAHLEHVEAEARELSARLDVSAADVLGRAGRWHDVGKAHPEWQRKIVQPAVDAGQPPPTPDGVWAKSPHRLRPPSGARKYLRHELASALAWLTHAPDEEPDRALIAYLLAAHHGKVRMAIRSGPQEEPAPDGRLFAHGIWDGDELPSVRQPAGASVPPTTLRLHLMQLGAGSWRELSIGLLEQHGPFRLAWLESALRAADWRASRKETEGAYDE
ncbi:MAG: CRISPR-associated endonuclease Cas3'' [Deltaproteobacteria bacterium]|nr:CRISPR-associated endonuclease Cas3'' [Deltaproteobacteria bacterium]